MQELKQACRGRWFGILTGVGISETYLTGKHTPCPICQGTDRFRWTNENNDGGWFCNQCSPKAGDGLSLVQKHLGLNFPDTIKRIKEIVGVCDKMSIKPQSDPKLALNQLWETSKDLTGNDFVSKYLHSRGLTLMPSNVRFCERCYESDTKKQLHAMIVKVQNKAGKPISLHRTYLEGSDKANIKSPKKLMPSTELLRGSAIRLFSPTDKLFESNILGICEGIESSISAAQMYGIAVWSCISSTLMESWVPPDGIREIIIFGDKDSNFTGEKSAFILANRLYLKDLLVDVVFPEKRGMDFNDVLLDIK